MMKHSDPVHKLINGVVDLSTLLFTQDTHSDQCQQKPKQELIPPERPEGGLSVCLSVRLAINLFFLSWHFRGFS